MGPALRGGSDVQVKSNLTTCHPRGTIKDLLIINDVVDQVRDGARVERARDATEDKARFCREGVGQVERR